jgi:arylsulfatase A-like enzyme
MNTTLRALLLIVVVGAAGAVGIADDRPNIIFFLSDDQRDDFLGCAGHPFLKTPHIDRLAEQGTRFENAFVTTSICAASRATLLTGLWERTHKYTFRTPPLAEEFVDASYPMLLREAGYRTGFVGKFGVGAGRGKPGEMFDSFVPLNRNPYFKEQPDGSLRHLTDIEGDRSIEFIESCTDGQPFCLSVSFNAAHAEDSDKENHYPWAPAEDGLYEDVTIPQPLVDTEFWKQLPEFFRESMHRERWFWRWDTPEKYQKNMRAYFRMITGLDRNIGRVLEAVERQGFGEKTVVIFMGDNGYYAGSRGFAGKWSHYEESLRVPLVIHDPRAPESAQGQVTPLLALNVDVPATIMALATGSVPDSYQGRDLTPIVHGASPTDWREDFFCEHLMDHPPIPKWEGVRGQRYVYARYFEHLPEGEFLHDLEADPRQLKNFADDPEYAQILETMRARCDELRDKYGGEYSLEKFPTVQSLRQQRRD